MSTVPPIIPGSGLYSSLEIYSANFNNVEVVNSVNIWKGYINAVTTTDVSLSGLQTIDTVGLGTGSIVLAKDQNDKVDNGIYIVNAGDWNRSPVLVNGSSAKGIGMISTNGAVNKHRVFICSNTEDSVKVGTSELSFVTCIDEASPVGSNGQLQYLYNGLLMNDTSITDSSGRFTASSLSVSGSIITNTIKAPEYRINGSTGTGIYLNADVIQISKDSDALLSVYSDKVVNDLNASYSNSYLFSETSVGLTTTGNDVRFVNGNNYLSFTNDGTFTNSDTMTESLRFNATSGLMSSSNGLHFSIKNNHYLTLGHSNESEVHIVSTEFNTQSGTGFSYSNDSISVSIEGTEVMELSQNGIVNYSTVIAPSYYIEIFGNGIENDGTNMSLVIGGNTMMSLGENAIATVPVTAPEFLFNSDLSTGFSQTMDSLNFFTGGTTAMQLNSDSLITKYDMYLPEGNLTNLSLTTSTNESGIYTDSDAINLVVNQTSFMTISSVSVESNNSIVTSAIIGSSSLNCDTIIDITTLPSALSLQNGMYNFEGIADNTFRDFLNIDMNSIYILNGSTGSVSFVYFIYRNTNNAVGILVSGSATDLNIASNVLQLRSNDNTFYLNIVKNG